MAWRIIGASIEGLSHRLANWGCDDHHGYRVMDDRLLLAVTDGAGSAQLGGEGARIASEAVLDALADAFIEPSQNPQALLLQAFRTARHLLKAEALIRHKPLREFATTLLVAVWTPEYLAAAQLGDGAIVAKQNGNWQMLTQRHKGEHANETVFLTMREPRRFTSVAVYPLAEPVDAVMLLSDGLENIALNLRQNQPHQPFFEALYRFAKRGEEVETLNMLLRQELSSELIESRSNDDKTLLMALPEPS